MRKRIQFETHESHNVAFLASTPDKKGLGMVKNVDKTFRGVREADIAQTELTKDLYFGCGASACQGSIDLKTVATPDGVRSAVGTSLECEEVTCPYFPEQTEAVVVINTPVQ